MKQTFTYLAFALCLNSFTAGCDFSTLPGTGAAVEIKNFTSPCFPWQDEWGRSGLYAREELSTSRDDDETLAVFSRLVYEDSACSTTLYSYLVEGEYKTLAESGLEGLLSAEYNSAYIYAVIESQSYTMTISNESFYNERLTAGLCGISSLQINTPYELAALTCAPVSADVTVSNMLYLFYEPVSSGRSYAVASVDQAVFPAAFRLNDSSETVIYYP